jgi:hypothetical protein
MPGKPAPYDNDKRVCTCITSGKREDKMGPNSSKSNFRSLNTAGGFDTAGSSVFTPGENFGVNVRQKYRYFFNMYTLSME